MNSNLKKLVIESGNERAMVCTRHLRQNANQKLVDDAVDKREEDRIMGMIFGEDGISMLTIRYALLKSVRTLMSIAAVCR